MRIGILTLPVHINYGGILQAYALQTVLERLGHKVVILDRQVNYEQPLFRMAMVLPVRLIKKLFGLHKGTVWIEKAKQEKKQLAQQNTKKFIERHLHIYPFYDVANINLKDFDAIVVGSDQIWRARYFRNISNNPADMFLAFADKWNIKRFAYAASFGTDQWELDEKETEESLHYAKKFDAISVREDSGVKLCRENLGIASEHVLDPTMLLTRDEYKTLINIECSTKCALVSYILDRDADKANIVDALSKRFGKEYSINRQEYPVPSVEFWLEGMVRAERMVTDSFHGTAFSINFNIPFVVLSNQSRGQSRLESILKMFHLENRMVYSLEQALEIIDTPIDWDMVNNILANQRNKSITFLSKI